MYIIYNILLLQDKHDDSCNINSSSSYIIHQHNIINMDKSIEKTPYVFVYGTLMKGFGNNRLLKNSERVGVATTVNKLKLFASSIPFLVNEKGSSVISGEIYRVNERALKQLDALEGHPQWYKREVITVTDEVGDSFKAWVYFMPKDNMGRNISEIPSGDYKDYAEFTF